MGNKSPNPTEAIYTVDTSKLAPAKVKKDPTWVGDSGASSPFCKDIIWLIDIEKIPKIYIKCAGNQTLSSTIKGTAKIPIRNHNGLLLRYLLLKNCLYVPGLQRNLISIPSFVKGGKSANFVANSASLMSTKGEVLAKLQKQQGLYVLNTTQPNPKVTPWILSFVNSDRIAPGVLWHNRLGDLNDQYLNQMQKIGTIGLSKDIKFNNHHCEECKQGKSTRASFKKMRENHLPTEILDEVHSDITGPMRSRDRYGHRYFMSMIDGKTRKSELHLLKHKHEATAIVENYINRHKTSHSKTVRRINTDGGGEYVNKRLTKFCASTGTKHTVTNVETPEHNSIAERWNRTIKEMATVFLLRAKLSQKWWGDAAKMANYIHLKRPTKYIMDNEEGKLSPESSWTDQPTDVSMLRTPFCRAYVHTVKGDRPGSFSKRAEPGMFIGYGNMLGDGSHERHGYKIYLLKSKTTVYSRNVTFDETQFGLIHKETVSQEELLRTFEIDNETRLTAIKRNREESLTETPTTPHKQKRQKISARTTPRRSKRTHKPNKLYAKLLSQFHGLSTDSANNLIKESSLFTSTVADALDNKQEEIIREDEKNILDEQTWYEEVANLLSEQAQLINDMQDTNLPRFISEALHGINSEEWTAAAVKELLGLKKKETWDLVPRPRDVKVVGSKWVFKIKYKADGSVERYKCRLVAQGFTQIKGENFTDTYAPVAQTTTIMMLLALAAQRGQKIHQMDFVLAYLNSDIDTDIYMEQAEGFKETGKEDHVYKLKKSIYGLKQSAKLWNDTLTTCLKELGFKQSRADPCVYTLDQDGDNITLAVYVDDLLMFGSNEVLIEKIKKQLAKKFEMKDLGEANWIRNT